MDSNQPSPEEGMERSDQPNAPRREPDSNRHNPEESSTRYDWLKDKLLSSSDISQLEDCFALCYDTNDHERNRKLRASIMKLVRSGGGTRALDLYWKTHLFDAYDSLDSFILYTEHNRDPSKQFYLPRRKQLLPLVESLEDLEYRRLEILGLSLPPGVGKTTLAEFFLTWTGGRHPEKPILTGSHSNAFLRGMYGEINRMLDPTGDYLWNDVFPDLHVINTNAQDMLIDVGQDKKDAKRFTTYQFSSVGSGNAGKVRAENLLYCDDLVDGLESALSRERMDKLYNLYATDLRQRKIGDAVELHIATRWSVHDVIGRLQQLYADNPTARFIACPALDENDESNFDYPIDAGFSTRFYHEQRNAMDDISWKALYMNEPIEREGLLYHEDELRRYFDLPEAEPDAVISVCDTKDKGIDYCVMPIAFQYGDNYYIEDFICDNSNPDIVEERLVQILLKYNVMGSRFESNSAGGKIAEKVQKLVKDRGGNTRITTKYSTQNKETKIILAAGFVKEHFLFKDNSTLTTNKEYRTAMNFLCSYTMAGKNKHDDVPDALAMLADYIQTLTIQPVQIIKRFF